MFLFYVYKCGIKSSLSWEKASCGRQSARGSRPVSPLPRRRGVKFLWEPLPVLCFLSSVFESRAARTMGLDKEGFGS